MKLRLYECSAGERIRSFVTWLSHVCATWNWVYQARKIDWHGLLVSVTEMYIPLYGHGV